MDYTLNTSPVPFKHRETQFNDFVTLYPSSFSIDNVRVIVARLHTDQNWYIINGLLSDDDYFQDIGPFTTHEDALVHLRLAGDKR